MSKQRQEIKISRRLQETLGPICAANGHAIQEYVTLPPVRRIIAIGDIHGDLPWLKSILRLAGIINSRNEWIGQDTVVVQTGDQVDGCRPSSNDPEACLQHRKPASENNDDIQVLNFVDQLAKQAAAVGGKVIPLIGNHELMNVEGQSRAYTSPASLNRFGGKIQQREKAFHPGNSEAIRLACTRSPFVIVGDWLFGHSGFVPNQGINNVDDLVKFDERIRTVLATSGQRLQGARDWDPFTQRLTSTATNPQTCNTYVKPVIDLFALKGMIIGHTITESHTIETKCNDQVFQIDVGGSSAFDFNPKPQATALEILNNSNIRILK